MKKFVSVLSVLLCCVSLLAGCGCRHEWAAANCTTAKTCELCGITEGEAKGHIWVDATCEMPKKCSVCHLTEGQALSHNWEEATTEAPKTCVNCQATEGSKLQADPRFTTAATKHLHGKWACDVDFNGEILGVSVPGYFESVPAILSYEFGKTGELTAHVELKDYLAFMDEYARMTEDLTYEILAGAGIGKEDADMAMQEVYGMSMSQYVESAVAEIDLDDIFGAFTVDGVYYVGQNGIYISNSWYGEFTCGEYTLENDVLIIADLALEEGGEPLQLKRVTED